MSKIIINQFATPFNYRYIEQVRFTTTRSIHLAVTSKEVLYRSKLSFLDNSLFLSENKKNVRAKELRIHLLCFTLQHGTKNLVGIRTISYNEILRLGLK